MKWSIRFLSLIAVGLSIGCVSPPPVEDYNLARAAIRAAKTQKAQQFAPGLWHEAEVSYRRAKGYYSDREYAKAEKHFLRTIRYAEKAETKSRIKRYQGGG